MTPKPLVLFAACLTVAIPVDAIDSDYSNSDIEPAAIEKVLADHATEFEKLESEPSRCALKLELAAKLMRRVETIENKESVPYAVAAYEYVLQHGSPRQSVRANAGISYALSFEGKKQSALTILERINPSVLNVPERFAFHANRGQLFLSVDKPAEAMRSFASAVAVAKAAEGPLPAVVAEDLVAALGTRHSAERVAIAADICEALSNRFEHELAAELAMTALQFPDWRTDPGARRFVVTIAELLASEGVYPGHYNRRYAAKLLRFADGHDKLGTFIKQLDKVYRGDLSLEKVASGDLGAIDQWLVEERDREAMAALLVMLGDYYTSLPRSDYESTADAAAAAYVTAGRLGHAPLQMFAAAAGVLADFPSRSSTEVVQNLSGPYIDKHTLAEPAVVDQVSLISLRRDCAYLHSLDSKYSEATRQLKLAMSLADDPRFGIEHRERYHLALSLDEGKIKTAELQSDITDMLAVIEGHASRNQQLAEKLDRRLAAEAMVKTNMEKYQTVINSSAAERKTLTDQLAELDAWKEGASQARSDEGPFWPFVSLSACLGLLAGSGLTWISTSRAKRESMLSDFLCFFGLQSSSSKLNTPSLLQIQIWHSVADDMKEIAVVSKMPPSKQADRAVEIATRIQSVLSIYPDQPHISMISEATKAVISQLRQKSISKSKARQTVSTRASDVSEKLSVYQVQLAQFLERFIG